MKRSVLIALVLVFGASMAFAQAGSVDIFADPGYTDCNVVDAAPALAQIYVVHTNSPEATAVQFAIDYGASTMTITGEVSDYLTIGDTVNGLSVAYGQCLASPILAVTVNLFTSGTTPSCTYLSVVPDPNVASGKIEAVDCNTFRMFPTGGQAIVNATPDCTCNTPVEDTTWGGVKALYQ